jgi:hypothetical protein
VTFTAQAEAVQGRQFEWLFGDGSRFLGRQVTHNFQDAMGTLLDRSGKFRVLLQITDSTGDQSWSDQSVVISRNSLEPYQKNQGESAKQTKAGVRVEDRLIQIPADGGYTFTLLTSTQGSLQIDDLTPVHTPPVRPQVCGSVGDAVQPVRKSIALKHGIHRIRIERNFAVETAEPLSGNPIGDPILLWEGPNIMRQPVPVYHGIQ